MDGFVILSDNKIFCIDKYDDTLLQTLDSANRPGTIVYMTLSNNTKKTAREIFDRYADVEGGFTRTGIPMKNLFDASPVSRSQAKRLCNRLDRFESVTLDFDGLDWIGQGFAHQLFVVFPHEHPEVRLEPVHMSEPVSKMYHHVLAEKNP